jgi:hypothetical protein
MLPVGDTTLWWDANNKWITKSVTGVIFLCFPLLSVWQPDNCSCSEKSLYCSRPPSFCWVAFLHGFRFLLQQVRGSLDFQGASRLWTGGWIWLEYWGNQFRWINYPTQWCATGVPPRPSRCATKFSLLIIFIFIMRLSDMYKYYSILIYFQ